MLLPGVHSFCFFRNWTRNSFAVGRSWRHSIHNRERAKTVVAVRAARATNSAEDGRWFVVFISVISARELFLIYDEKLLDAKSNVATQTDYTFRNNSLPFEHGGMWKGSEGREPR